VPDSVVAAQLAYFIDREPLGRRRLAQKTGLTEMAVRIELERMRDQQFVTLGRAGVELTLPGHQHFAPILDRVRAIEPVDLTNLRVDTVALAAQIVGKTRDPVWSLRDTAVREGATGLLLLRFGPDGWAFAHNEEPARLQNRLDAETLETMFPGAAPDELLIIVSAPGRGPAGLGLWRVLLAVLALAK